MSPSRTAPANVAEFPLRRGVEDKTNAFILSSPQQLSRSLIERARKCLQTTRRGGAVPPRRLEYAQLRIRHLQNFRGIVVRREIKIGTTWHDDRPGTDGPQSALEITTVNVVVSHVGVLSLPTLCSKV